VKVRHRLRFHPPAGVLLEDGGKAGEAKIEYERAVAVWREAGNKAGIAVGLSNVANVLQSLGDLAGAQKARLEALAISREVDDKQGNKDLLTRSLNPETHFQLGIVAGLVESALGKNISAESELKAVLVGATKHKYVGYQLEARLALGEIETGSGKIADGHTRLAALQKDAAAKGFVLIARKAAHADDQKLASK
jgi:tetratricopeptide (TPR) repeat protein